MAAGTSPIFVATPKSSWIGAVATANTDVTMTTGTSYLIATAGANGSKIEDIFICPLGTNVSATVIRFFVNNGSSTGTAVNNSLVHEETLAATTVSQVAALVPVVWKANLILPANYKLYCTLGTTIAAGVCVTAQGGDY